MRLLTEPNFSCSFTDDPNPDHRNQITRAASLTHAAVSFSQAIRTDTLPVDQVRGVPLCMNQYWWLFGVTRVPCPDGGRIRLDVDSRHIVVFCRGQIYRLDVVEENSGHVIGIHELQKQLGSILRDSNALRADEATKSSLGVFTTGNQKAWSHWRSTLVRDGLKNGRNLAVIDSSLFALCLDESSPESRPDICKNMICGTNVVENGVQAGTCLNRWYDKLSIIVCRNGAAGMNFEHTCTDGSVDIGMACEIYKRSVSQQENAVNGINTSPANGLGDGQLAASGRLQKLEWVITTEVSAAMQEAGKMLQSRIDQHQLATLDVHGYGKDYIKSKGFPPDAFFQMSLQAAYFRAYGSIRSGFEPVHTRQYLHGRTDVVRTTTTAAAAWARTFSDGDSSDPEKIEALRRATEAHVALSKDCTKGLSHHRHLGVLQKMWKGRQAFLEVAGLGRVTSKGEEGPTIFTDAGWSRLGTSILTGSNVDNPYIAYAGFGPLAADGFTVTYYIREGHMAMSVTSKNGQAAQFADTIEETLQGIKKLLDSK